VAINSGLRTVSTSSFLAVFFDARFLVDFFFAAGADFFSAHILLDLLEIPTGRRPFGVASVETVKDCATENTEKKTIARMYDLILVKCWCDAV